MGVFYRAMKRRLLTIAGALFASVLTLAGFAIANLGTAQTTAQHIAFVIATGSTGGTYFPVGQAIAGIVSHPPGIARCDAAGVCGPAGLVASVRSSEGSIANIRDVQAGRADGGLAQSNIVAEAVAGKGDFRRDGAARHLRMIADLYPEDVHLIAATHARIRRVSDLRGKRVVIGARESGTASTTREILAAYHIGEREMHTIYAPPEVAAQRLQKGEVDAVFFVGGAPIEFVRSVLGGGKATLVPIDGAGRKRLVAEGKGLSAQTIAADSYPGIKKPLETVGVQAVLIVNDTVAPEIVYGMTRALFNPANRALLDEAHPVARFIRLEDATKDVPAPLHPGAARFYRETGVLPRSGG
ncbi:MAG TPA: TAXI family TRAP transporter solute-binding subunit [Rhizomicrobium sp.]|nr:TAXI family TRAP transporter solute-binding subunit [Rhizomicrobium sp.]